MFKISTSLTVNMPILDVFRHNWLCCYTVAAACILALLSVVVMRAHTKVCSVLKLTVSICVCIVLGLSDASACCCSLWQCEDG